MLRLAFALLGCLGIACGGPLDEAGLDDSELVGGSSAEGVRPEVGKLWFDGQYCTATLIRQDIAITAAHCVQYTSAVERVGSIELSGPGGALRAQIVERKSFSNRPGLYDIALVRLETPVPTRVARAAPLSRVAPRTGDSLRLFGFGCDERGESASAGKTSRRVRYGSSQVICRGDSGGPGFLDSGSVGAIISAYSRTSGADIFALPTLLVSEIDAQLRAWGASVSTPAATTPLPGARVWKKDGTVGRCGTWTLPEDFSSGRYDAHQLRLALPAGEVEIEVDVVEGAWSPRLVIATTGGAKIYEGAGDAARGGVTVTEHDSGDGAELAAVRVRLDQPTTLDVYLTSWAASRASYSTGVPRSARYRVEAQSLCP